MSTRRLPPGAAAAGQALVEFLGLALILVPFLLLLPMIAKYQDIAHATDMAARYVAFDATVRNDANGGNWKPNGELAGEVRRRFFSNPTAPIKTNDTPGDFKAHQNLFWRDPLDNALIRNFDSDVRISFGESASPDRGAGFRGVNEGAIFIRHDALGVKARGVFRGNVSVSVANLPDSLTGPTKSYERLKSLDLVIRRHVDLVPDGWTAKDPDQTASRIDSAEINTGSTFKLPLFEFLPPVIEAAVVVMESPSGCFSHCGPKLGELDYWKEVVPADRIVRPRTGQ
ncbi:hypothetical protein LK540_12655 [Massilia sp. IC2-278]|uniref:hypothetical protein n=1 Tax=Massilia sp. IC2-278 TaxID=2887200 RepID=UPI001E316257|nr:hypothetical protein [Massilia sp. IC2-278]MCC2961273.1 hypothetical protein [Massilia sp. IC2-278]